MELIGPSVSAILKNAGGHKFGLSTAIRVAKHTLRALESLHRLGFVHRDIKPGNLLVRISPQAGQPPICLIDFGLCRIYQDQVTHEHEKARSRTGFRGTKTYASINAHALTDLSRRDDLASWFYVLLDIFLGTLPWKGVTNGVDVAVMKNRFDVMEAVHGWAPQLVEVWQHITSLRFPDEPDYRMIFGALDEICQTNNIRDDDPYDWAPFLEQYRKTLAGEFGVALRIDGGTDVLPYYSELGVPPVVMQEIDGRLGALRSPLLRQRPRNYSVMQLSELNEKDDSGCCC
jgi:serine/threonine protein kinase